MRGKTGFIRNSIRTSRRGQTLVEYVYILSFISIIAVAVMINLQTQVRSSKNTVNQKLAASQSYH